MTADQHSAPRCADEAPSAPMLRIEQWFPAHRSAITLLLSWLAPAMFMCIGAGFPALRSEISLPWAASGDIWEGLFVQLVFVFAWIIYEIWYATHRNTSIGQLQADTAGDLTVAFLLLLAGAAWITIDALPWWFVVPMLGSIVDVYLAPVLAINNAAEKPFFSARGSV